MKRRIIAVLLGCSIACLVGEGALRTLCWLRLAPKVCFNRDVAPMALDQIDDLDLLLDTVPLSLHPYQNCHGFILNSKRLRTPEYEVATPDSVLRVFVIGDSFAFDSGRLPYPLHFTVLLEDRLAEWLERPVEVINLGQPGVGPRFEQRILEIEALPHDADLVVWLFFVGNDFTEESYQTKDTPWLPERYDWVAIKRYLCIRSYLCRALRNIYTILRYMEEAPSSGSAVTVGGIYVGDPKEYDPNQATFDRNQFLAIQSHRMLVYSEERFPRFNWEAIQDILREVRDACGEAGVRLLVVIVPDENQVNDDLLGDVMEWRKWSLGDFEMDYPQRLLVDFFTAEGIHHLDLLPTFREASREKALYALRDTHWNHEGNRLAADLIFQYLRTAEEWFAR
jgi:hypothetical protein